MEDFYQFDEEHRDSIATVDAEGKRIWVYPKKPSGKFHNYRILVTAILLSIFFAGPFLTIGSKPFLLLNIFERKFVILGQAFWPQDFFIFALLAVTFFVFVILFTVSFGRIWCGWACPQTLFMEMVFRKIEYLIEGDANKQKKLNAAPWNTEKITKKGLKQFVFITISLLISHTVMAYLIGWQEVKEVVSHSPTEHLSGFIGLMVFTGIFYWVFSYFREQACVVVCPYGRLQGVLIVKDTLVVAYDWLRGEPRGKLKKNKVQEDKGDCIDCKLCVHACPTGIDIRNGTQLECVNCTACIDACDDVMVKINKPKGLIRYASENGIKEGKSKVLNARMVAYSVVLVVLLGFLSFMLFTRADVDTTVLKVPGMLYQKDDDGRITNLYNIQFVNKTFDDKQLEIRVENVPSAEIVQVGAQDIHLAPDEIYKGVFFIKIPPEDMDGARMTLYIGIYNKDGELIDQEKTRFLGPLN